MSSGLPAVREVVWLHLVTFGYIWLHLALGNGRPARRAPRRCPGLAPLAQPRPLPPASPSHGPRVRSCGRSAPRFGRARTRVGLGKASGDSEAADRSRGRGPLLPAPGARVGGAPMAGPPFPVRL